MTHSAQRQLPSGDHEIVLDGVRQVFHTAGRGPVMVAHSGGPGASYETLRSEGLEQHFTMVYVEPVGTGASGRLPDPTAYSMDVYVRFLAAVIEHLQVGPVYVLGHSYGGCVAQQITLDHPGLVAGLVLYDSTPVLNEEFVEAAGEAAIVFGERHKDQPEAVAAVEAFFSRPDSDESAAVRTRAVKPLYFGDFWAHRERLAPLLARQRSFVDPGRAKDARSFDARARLGEITVPTVIIVGAQDFICGPRWAGRLHDGIPGSRLVVLKNSGHYGHLEEPGAFVEAVVSGLPVAG
ncbi:alpha/beta hydrolase [Actinoplanes sp. NPDC049596]|uniref:alpha/beta fold hydrolase n=1 Tax=unclassified Actinoplanes TaxID=2626549 RepID=UPI00343D8334